jgi:hypothetical protein
MFAYNYIIFNLIDRCTRWHAACLVQSKEDHALLEALNSTWVGIDGPMRVLIIDGEAGLAAAGYSVKDGTILKTSDLNYDPFGEAGGDLR